MEFAPLRNGIRTLREERDILKKRWPFSRAKVDEIYFIEKEKVNFPICSKFKVLRVIESGYYAWLSHHARQRQCDNMVFLAYSVPRMNVINVLMVESAWQMNQKIKGLHR